MWLWGILTISNWCHTYSNPFQLQSVSLGWHARKSSIRSFDEELQLYEMLDLDAEGEEDVGVDVDDDTGDLLMNWTYYSIVI